MVDAPNSRFWPSRNMPRQAIRLLRLVCSSSQPGADGSSDGRLLANQSMTIGILLAPSLRHAKEVRCLTFRD